MLYLILLLPLAMAALSLIRNDRARTVILAVGQALLLALLIGACTLGDTATPVWRMTADLTFSLRLDGLGRFFCLLTAVCWLLTIPYAAVYMTHEGASSPFLCVPDADGGGGAGRRPGGRPGDSIPVL